MDESEEPEEPFWVKVTRFHNPDGTRCEADSFLDDGINALPDLNVEIRGHWEQEGEEKKSVPLQVNKKSTKARSGDTNGVVRWITEKTGRKRHRFFPNKG